MRQHAPLLALLLLLFVSPIVTAQSTIDRGTVNFTGSYLFTPLARFKFEGPQELTLTGQLRTGLFSPYCAPCLGGQQASIGSTISAETSSTPGTMTVEGVSRDVYYVGNLTFGGASVTLPIRFSRLPFTIVAPITAQGTLGVYGHDPFDNSTNPLFTFPVNLQGKATVTLRLQGIMPSGQPYYQVLASTYEFPQAAKSEKN